MMIAKKHITPDRRLLLAVCDTDIRGKKLEDGKIQLDLSSDFYDGEEMEKEKIKELMKKSSIVNLAGDESVRCGIEAGIVEKENIIDICNVPTAQAIIVEEN